MANLTINNPYFWAGLSGICDSIVKGTAADDYALMTEDALALFTEIANLTPKQMIQLALTMWEMEQDEAKEAQARA